VAERHVGLVQAIPTALPPPDRGAHPKAFLATDTGLKLILPLAPEEVDHDGFADPHEALDREGRKPIVQRTGEGLRTFALELELATRNPTGSVDPLVATLAAIASSSARVTVSYGPLERGVWKISGCSVRTTRRLHGSNGTHRATAVVTFLEASDAVVKVGPMTGGAKPAPSKPAPKTAAPAAIRYHVVKAGETPAKISLAYYGDADLWQKLLSAQSPKITDPRKLKAGTRLRIPPKAKL
jgi:nucleoid-associated protein YgaU